MEPAMIIEIIGYIGSALVVISMLMSSVIKLRIINLVGSVVSGGYAIVVGAIPLALMNACLIVINIWNLYKLMSVKTEYELSSGASNDASVSFFLDSYGDDIKKYFPGYRKSKMADKKVFVVYCEKKPAGIMVGEMEGDRFNVLLDYSIPQYRDCSVGRYLYSALSEKSIKSLRYCEELTDAHASYLMKMGYKKENGVYVKNL